MHRTSTAHTDLMSDLRDVKDDLRDELRILVDTVAPRVETAAQGMAQGVAERLPDNVVDRLPDAVVDRLPIKRSHRGRNLLILAGIGALGAAAWVAMRRRPAPQSYDRTDSADFATPDSVDH
jgi:hypothetical protein